MLQIAICDDEKQIREALKELTLSCVDAKIHLFADGEALLESEIEFDIILLDICIEEAAGHKMNGIETAKRIRKNSDAVIIFITALKEYVFEAYDVEAFHYLLKPIDEEKFRSVFRRALDELYAVMERTKRFILVRNSGIQQKVYLKDIYYIESANKKIIIHTKMGVLDSYRKMNELEQMTGRGFYRCHRCYLVNMEQIVSYNADTIKVVNGDKLILAQKKYNDFIRQYMKYAKDGGIVNV